MSFSSLTSADFWRCYRQLPPEIRQLARKAYRIWQQDAFHPSLHFKKLTDEHWSVRIGLHYRAIGSFHADQFVWTWIGSHGDYDRILQSND